MLTDNPGSSGPKQAPIGKEVSAMASHPPVEPDSVPPQSPPERTPPEPEPLNPTPDETGPLEPDFDQPDCNPDEWPSD